MDRNSPLDRMESLLEQMGEQFETAAESWGTGLDTWTPESGSPRLDFVSTEESYLIEAELPGFEPDDVEIHLTDDTLSIDAERSTERTDDSAEFIRQERSHESMTRRVSLPGDADTDDITASMDAGLLTVQIGRTEPISDGHEIDID